MAPVSLSRQTARNLHLAAQGLLHAPARRATYADLLTAIRRMSLLQIDTIHVVARSPYLVLFSRLGDYPIAWLEQALAAGSLFEYWAHEACFIPAEDSRCCAIVCCNQKKWAGNIARHGWQNMPMRWRACCNISPPTGPCALLILPRRRVISRAGGPGSPISATWKIFSPPVS